MSSFILSFIRKVFFSNSASVYSCYLVSFLSVLSVKANAQTGTSCYDPVPVNVNITCESVPLEFLGSSTQSWVSFVPGTNSLTMTVDTNLATAAHIHKAYLYEGDTSGCPSLVVIDSLNMLDTLTYELTFTHPNKLHYLVFERPEPGNCGRIACQGTTVHYNLCLVNRSPTICVAVGMINYNTGTTISGGGICNTADYTTYPCHYSAWYHCEEFIFFYDCIAVTDGTIINWIIEDQNTGNIVQTSSTTAPNNNGFIPSGLPVGSYFVYYNYTESGITYTSSVVSITYLEDVVDQLFTSPTPNLCTGMDFAYAWIPYSFANIQQVTIDGNIIYTQLNDDFVDDYLFQFYPNGQNYFDLAVYNGLSIGSHQICIFYTEPCGNSYTFCDYFTKLPNISFSFDVACDKVIVNNTTQCLNLVSDFTWDFGDGTIISDAFPTHVYAIAGVHNGILTATWTDGTVETFPFTIETGLPFSPVINGSNTLCANSFCYNVDPAYSNIIWTVNPSVVQITSALPEIACLDPATIPVNTSLILSVSLTDQFGCPGNSEILIHQCCIDPNDPSIMYETDPNQPMNISTTSWYTSITSGSIVYVFNDLHIDANTTYNNINFLMAPGTSIIVDPGVNFRLDNSLVRNMCREMWQGIYIQQSNSTFSANNTTFMQAENAVFSKNGGVYQINNCIFTNNYKGIVVNYGNNSGSIRGTTFSSVTGALESPHNNPAERGYAGVETNFCSNTRIGQLAAQWNTFDNLDYGIYGFHSELTVQHNKFQHINHGYNGLYGTTGSAVYCRSTTTFSAPQSIIIGGNVATANNFTDCYKGILLEGNFNSTIRSNNLTAITGIGIEILNATNNNFIDIRANELNNFGYGIACLAFNGSTVNIINNNLQKQNNYTPQTVQNIGILAQNVKAFTATLNILNNTIDYARKGIWVTNVVGAHVKANTIQYNVPNAIITAVNTIYTGITAENSMNIEIYDNTIARSGGNPAQYNGTAAVLHKLQGIYTDASAQAFISSNTITQMGSGLYFSGLNQNSTVSCNNMNKCWNGIYFNNADIGDQGGPNDPTDNKWNNNQDVFHMSGLLVIDPSTGTQIDWYSRNIGAYQSAPVNFIPSTGMNISSAIGPLDCPTFGGGGIPHNPMIRSAMFSYMVPNQRNFTVNNPQNKKSDKQYLYSILKADTSLLTLGTLDDADYQNFYVNETGSDIGRLASIDDLIYLGNYNTAINLNNTLLSTDTLIQNEKDANGIYLQTWVNNEYGYDPIQENTLENIACQDPMPGGTNGVFAARVLLSPEYDCGGTSRSMDVTSDNSMGIEIDSKIYPNPNDGNFYLSISDIQENQTIKVNIVNIFGNLVHTRNVNLVSNQIHLNLEELTPGMYFVEMYADGKIIMTDRFIISR